MYFEPRGDAPAALVLGCMNFGRRTPRAEALRIVDRAAGAGVRLLDTANAYGDGESERIVGEAVRGRELLVATKVGFGRIDGRLEGLAPSRVLAACDESLARLGIDRIDLYYLHVPDYAVPMDETVGAVAELLRTGRIARWGVSNFASWQVLELRRLAAAAGIPGPVVAQQLYNPLIRQLDVEWFKYTRYAPIHTTVYNPLAGGLLSGKHRFEAIPAGSRFDGNALYQRRYWQRAQFAAIEQLESIAADAGVSLVGLAYGFVLGHPGVDSVLVGPGTVAHLEDAIVSTGIRLDPEIRRRVEQVYVDLVGTDATYAR